MSKAALATDPTGASNYYNALQAAGQAALGSIIQGTLTPIQAGSQGDFAYNFVNSNSSPPLFNLWSYNFTSADITQGTYGNAAQVGTSGSFSTGFLQLVNQTLYQFSGADSATISKSTTLAQQQQNNVVQTWNGLYGLVTQSMIQSAAAWLSPIPSQQTPFNYIVNYVVGGVWAGKTAPLGLSLTTMQNAANLSALLPNMPADGSPIVSAISAYLNAFGPAAALIDQQNFGNFMISSIQRALNPNPITSVLPASSSITVFDPAGIQPNSVQPAYAITKSAQQIINDLNTTSNVINMSIEVQQSNSSQYQLSINEGSSFSFGGPLVTFDVSQQSSFNMESIQGAGDSLTISIQYKGYSVVPFQPQPFTMSGPSGWYFPTLIAEAYANYQLGSNAPSGFNFVNPPALDLSQYPNGAFNMLSNLVVSTYPKITITYNAGNYSQFSQNFSAQASGQVKLFGAIPVGGASMSTYQSQLQQGSSNTNFSVSFGPPSPTNVPMYEQTACVIGGVIVSPAQLPTSAVNTVVAFS